MSIEIVSHCWRYSRLLCYQLSSLLLRPPQRCAVVMSIFCTEEDEGTMSALDFFETQPFPANISLKRCLLPRELLMRREIGRNFAALATGSDWVWFTDCDYCFGEGTLDTLVTAVPHVNENLFYPRQIMISKTHELGDCAIRRLTRGPAVVDICPDDFMPHTFHRAIGGVQIVRGSVARERGYLRDSSLQRQTSREWQRCIGDVRFRKSLGTSGAPLILPSVFRIRHSAKGYRQRGIEL